MRSSDSRYAKLFSIPFFLVLGISLAHAGDTKLVFPKPPTSNQADDYFGTKVADPYRPLENLDSPRDPEMDRGGKQTHLRLPGQVPERKQINDRLTTLWNYEKYGVPFHESGNYFFTKNTGLQNQSVVYVTPNLPGEPRVLLDPNLLSSDGTVALSGLAVPQTGNFLAYGLATAGSDWQEWKVRDIATGKDRADDLKWVKFSGASWTHDGTGFYYSRYDDPKNRRAQGRPITFTSSTITRWARRRIEDVLVYQRKDHKEWLFNGDVTDDGRYLIINVSQGTDPKNRIFYKDLKKPDSKVVELLNKQDAAYSFLDNDGPLFWFRTDLNAPRGRIVAIDVRAPGRRSRRSCRKQEDKLERVNRVGDRFVADYLKDAHSVGHAVRVDRQSRRAKFRCPGWERPAASPANAKRWKHFIRLSASPSRRRFIVTILRPARATALFRPQGRFQIGRLRDRAGLLSKQGRHARADVHHLRKGPGEKRRAIRRCFTATADSIFPLRPTFSPATAVWLEMGGIYAMANLRGGGEYGEQWHLAGTKAAQTKCVRRFHRRGGMADREQIHVRRRNSRSAAGATAACWSALLDPAAGSLGRGAARRRRDGHAAVPEIHHRLGLGVRLRLADNAEKFKALYKYSPLHHIKPGTKYPPTLITTADHDDRVVPGTVSSLPPPCRPPRRARADSDPDRNPGRPRRRKPTAKIIEEATDKWAFLVKNLGMHVSVLV